MTARQEFSLSIWLMPEGAAYRKLAGINDSLSRKHNSPIIRPHVTIVGGFTGDIEQATYIAEDLSKQLKPFPVRFAGMDYKDEFFRSLYIIVEKTPVLLSAYETACRMFQKFDLDWAPDMPDKWLAHESLIYGDFNAAAKERIKRSIGNYPKGFMATKLYLVYNNERQFLWPTLAVFDLK